MGSLATAATSVSRKHSREASDPMVTRIVVYGGLVVAAAATVLDALVTDKGEPKPYK